MVEAGEFRDDLYYRINVIAIGLPRLAKRTDDIENLANHFLKIYAEKNSKDIESINENAMSFLKGYNFPGNIRELENIIERAVVLCKVNVLSTTDLPEKVKRFGMPASAEPSNIKELNDLKKKLWREVVEPVETSFILRLLDASGGNISAAARLGGLHRKQLQRILKRNSITSEIS
jgi:two-component system response regulator HydG